MAGGIKIATIGGGSSYTPELVEGFIKRYENLPVDELWLVDIPEGQEKLPARLVLSRSAWSSTLAFPLRSSSRPTAARHLTAPTS